MHKKTNLSLRLKRYGSPMFRTLEESMNSRNGRKANSRECHATVPSTSTTSTPSSSNALYNKMMKFQTTGFAAVIFDRSWENSFVVAVLVVFVPSLPWETTWWHLRDLSVCWRVVISDNAITRTIILFPPTEKSESKKFDFIFRRRSVKTLFSPL